MRNRKYDIERYLRGELSPSEMHALEKEALNDPFLAEALEGIEQAGRENFLYDLHQINRSVRDRMHKKSRRRGKSVRMWGWTSAIAASVLLVAVSGFLVLNLLRDQFARQQAENAEAETLLEPPSVKDTLTISFPAERPVIKRKVDTRPLAESPYAAAQAGDATRPADVSERNDPQPEDDATEEHALIAETQADKRNADLESPAEGAETKQDAEAGLAMSDKQAAEERVSRALQSRAAGIASKQAIPAAEADNEVLAAVGKVVDAKGTPLPGVNVMIKDTSVGTVTNVDGDFQLSLRPDNRRVVFAFIGYETQEVEVVKPVVNVTMKEDVTSLSEVVVTGHSEETNDQRNNSTFRFAEPEGGRNAFKNYLSKAVQYPQGAVVNNTEGKVTVRFTVGADGQLRDFEVLKGIGSGCEEALIRAIREGPAWKPSYRGDTPVEDKVTVRYRFKI